MLLQAIDLRKCHRRGARTVRALDGVSFDLAAGERVAIMGPSGSGKSTLLHILGALDRPDSGTLSLAGQSIESMTDGELSRFRRRKLGFVFQSFNLIPTLTALENAAWPLLLDGRDRSSSLARAAELLERVGLGGRQDHFPSQLSGGEMQRVAIARALSAKPQLLLADEPTGNLDSASGKQILKLLTEAVVADGGSLIMVTHDTGAAAYCDRTVTLCDGRVSI